jgi:4-hydroxy-tetrahydrodipicolinate reductase
MTEIHHTEKKDAPSGTAITLAEQILENIGRKKEWVNEQTIAPAELAIISKRIDPAPGTHIVKYSSAVDDIEIIHTAHNRKGFATGAVLAAEFLQDKKGIFGMKDVLGF